MSVNNGIQIDVLTTESGSSDAAKEVEKITHAADGVTDSSKKSTNAFGSLVKSFNFAIDPISLITQGLGYLKQALMAAVEAYGEAEIVGAQLDAVLQSTSGAAGLTRVELENLADSLSRLSGMDDEAIVRGEALLLTFTKIGEDVFPRATEAALNMSMAMGTDLQSAIIQVGKALNEPIQGASALRRVGVQLTDQQEEQIKQFMAVNDIASAQAIILKELQVEFGGVAEKMGDTTVGSTNRLKVAWGNLMETIGENPAGIWRSITEGLTGMVIAMDDATQRNKAHFDAIKQGNILMLEYGGSVAITRAQVKMYGDRVEQAGYEYQRAEQYGMAWKEALDAQTTSLDQQIPSLEEVSRANTDMLGLIMRLQGEYDTFTEKNQALKDKIAELTDEQSKFHEGSEKWDEYQGKIDEAKLSIEELAAQHEEAGRRIAFSLLQAKLGADGFTDAEFNGLLKVGQQWGLLDQTTVTAAQSMDSQMQQIADGFNGIDYYGKGANETVKKFTDSSKKLAEGSDPAKNNLVTMTEQLYVAKELQGTYSYKFVIQTIGSAPNFSTMNAEGVTVLGGGRAEGTRGWEVVPPGYPNDTYPIGLTSGERFAVIPNDSPPPPSGGGGGFGGNININISSFLSFADMNDAEAKLRPIIERAIRQSQGVI